MKDIEDFVKTSVKIDKQDNGEFGYFPFHCFVEKEDGSFDIICIAGVNGVEDVYKLMALYALQKAKRIYLAMDFPAGGDVKTDFVAVFNKNKNDFDAFIIPYDTKTGKVYERVKSCDQILHILSDLRHVAMKFMTQETFSDN